MRTTSNKMEDTHNQVGLMVKVKLPDVESVRTKECVVASREFVLLWCSLHGQSSEGVVSAWIDKFPDGITH